jgi:hypothetical protein
MRHHELLYAMHLQVIPIDDKGQLHEAFNMRIDELNVIDMKFLEGCAKPTIAVLYQDTKDARHIKTYEVVMKEKVWHSHAVQIMSFFCLVAGALGCFMGSTCWACLLVDFPTAASVHGTQRPALG